MCMFCNFVCTRQTDRQAGRQAFIRFHLNSAKQVKTREASRQPNVSQVNVCVCVCTHHVFVQNVLLMKIQQTPQNVQTQQHKLRRRELDRRLRMTTTKQCKFQIAAIRKRIKNHGSLTIHHTRSYGRR